MRATVDTATVARSRRSILAAAAGAAAASAAATLARPIAAAAADGDPLILGQSNSAASATGLDGRLLVNGQGGSLNDPSEIALRVTSLHGTAVRGESSGRRGSSTSGVCGVANEPFAIGVVAIGDANGTGLFVRARVQMPDRSGRATVLKGKASVDVDLRARGHLAGTPLCFANVMSYRPGTFVTMVRPNYPSGGVMRIYLNRAASSNTFVAWLVLN